MHYQINPKKIIKMKQIKAIDSIEKLNVNEMSNLKGGFSNSERTNNNMETQLSEDYEVICVNGKLYRIEKDGSIRPV